MKLFRVSLFFLVVAITRVFGRVPKYKSFANALNDIIERFYVKNNLDLHFLIGSLECEKFASDVISEMMKTNQNIGPVVVKKVRNLEEHRRKFTWLKLENSTIIFLKNRNMMAKLIEVIHLYSHPDYTKYQHLVVFEHHVPIVKTLNVTKENGMNVTKRFTTFVDLPEYAKQDFFSIIFNYMVFMYRDDDVLKLETIERFTKEDCGINMTKINEFSIKNQSWENDNFALIDTKDYNGCKIHVRITLSSVKPMYNTKLLFRIFREVGGKMNYNFTEYIKTPNQTEQYQNNIKIEGSIYERVIEASMGGFSQDSSNKLPFETAITLMDFAVIEPLGKEYTAYEKFILPFEPFTWVCCGATFGVAFLVIILINLTKNRELQDFVYGYHVNTPAFNVLVAFFGQSQNILPGRNFARFQLMMLILLCFFIRALYQGIQFDMTYMKLLKPSPDYVADIRYPIDYVKLLDPDKGNRLVALATFRYTYYALRDNDTKVLRNPPWSLAEYNGNRTIFPRYQGTDKKSMIFRFYNFTNPVKFTKDNIFRFSLGICFRNNDVLYKPFKDVIQRLIEAGITNTFEDQSLSQEPQYAGMFTVLDKGNDFARLSLATLEAGFVIWLVSFLATVVVFIGEIAFYFCQKLTKKMKIVVKEKLEIRKQKKNLKRDAEGNLTKIQRKHNRKIKKLQEKNLAKNLRAQKKEAKQFVKKLKKFEVCMVMEK